MSIYDNVLSGLRLAGVKVRDKDSLVESCLCRADLWEEVSLACGLRIMCTAASVEVSGLVPAPAARA